MHWFSRTHVTRQRTTPKTNFSGQLKKRRRLQETEVYSKLHYDDRILPAVNAAIAANGDEAKTIKIIRQVTKDLYENEAEEVKAAVISEMKAAELRVGEDNESQELKRTPEEYQA